MRSELIIPATMATRDQSRSKQNPIVRLTADDTEIFGLIWSHRFLRREHLCLLTSRSPKRLHRRLFKLEQSGFLKTIRLPQQKHLYGLTKFSVAVLVEEGIAPAEALDRRIRTHELKPLFLEHESMIVGIHVVLTAASALGGIRLLNWREGSDLYDTVTVTDPKKIGSHPVRPDAFFTLEDAARSVGGNQAHFALEADRSTTSQTRFGDKLRAYWEYIEQGKHVHKYGVKSFRVLTVALTEQRTRNLQALTRTILPVRALKYFLFAPRSRFVLESPERALGDVCLSPRDEVLHPLMPRAQMLAEGGKRAGQ